MANKGYSKVNEINNNNNQEETIDLFELAKVILKKIWIILICLVIGYAGGYAYSSRGYVARYQASAMIYVYTKTTSVTSLADIQIGSILTPDFQIIAQTREVMDAVKEDLGWTNETYESLVGRVNVTNPDNTHMLKITATDTDPVKAANLANSLANQLRFRIAEVMDTDPPSIVSKAIVPSYPLGYSFQRTALLGGLGLAAVAVAVIVIRFLLDDTIKTEEDIEKYLGQNVIGVLPMVSGIAKTSKKKY